MASGMLAAHVCSGFPLHLLGRERLGHQHVVINRDDVSAHLTYRFRKRVGRDDHPISVDLPARRADLQPAAFGGDRLSSTVVMDHTTKAFHRFGEAPDQAGWVEKRDRPYVDESSEIRG